MRRFRLGMAQMSACPGNMCRNLDTMKNLLSRTDADFVCFPEMSLSGYGAAYELEPADFSCGPVKELARISDDTGITVCAGISEHRNGRAYITQFTVEDGNIIGSYRKTHLGNDELKTYTPGNSIVPFDSKYCRLGFQLCWENHFPEITRKLAIEGADLVLMPHASFLNSKRRKSTWDRSLPAKAYDNTVYVGACNHLNGISGGGSCILDARGRTVAEDYGGTEGILSADLSPEPLEKIRNSGGSMRDLYFLPLRRPAIY